MNREELKALGLEDEQIDAVMKSHGTVVNQTKNDLDAVKEERDNLATQIEERDTQLEELGGKAKDSEELTAEIERLKTENAEATTKYQEQMAEQQKDFAIESTLREVKARDPKLAKKALDLDVIHIKEGKLIGLEEQLSALKESHEYLFDEVEPEKPAKPKFKGTQPGSQRKLDPSEPVDLSKMSYTEQIEFKNNYPEKYQELTQK